MSVQLLIGLWIGAPLGFLLCALMVISKRSDEAQETLRD